MAQRKPQKIRCKATSKRTGEQCKQWAVQGYDVCYMHGANPKNRGGGPRPNNKNAVKTGEYEAIWVDTLRGDEQKLYQEIKAEKLAQLDEEIRLTTIRERRMLQRIADLHDKDFTVVEKTKRRQTYTTRARDQNGQVAITGGNELTETMEKQEGTLGQIMRIEEALTRVQARKAQLIEIKHRIETAEGDDIDNLAGLRAVLVESAAARKAADTDGAAD